MKSTDSPLVVAEGLVKRFGELVAVDSINFAIAAGEVVGFLGPNGAGKTTTIRMLAGNSPRSGGRLEVFGLDVALHPREIKAQLGVVPQDNNYDPDLSVFENLLVYARYFGISTRIARQRATELLEFVHLTDKAGEKRAGSSIRRGCWCLTNRRQGSTRRRGGSSGSGCANCGSGA
jgi:lipooligosaccharide transport system ATP-binding protein